MQYMHWSLLVTKTTERAGEAARENVKAMMEKETFSTGKRTTFWLAIADHEKPAAAACTRIATT
jgi:hypothetical protein